MRHELAKYEGQQGYLTGEIKGVRKVNDTIIMLLIGRVEVDVAETREIVKVDHLHIRKRVEFIGEDFAPIVNNEGFGRYESYGKIVRYKRADGSHDFTFEPVSDAEFAQQEALLDVFDCERAYKIMERFPTKRFQAIYQTRQRVDLEDLPQFSKDDIALLKQQRGIASKLLVLMRQGKGYNVMSELHLSEQIEVMAGFIRHVDISLENIATTNRLRSKLTTRKPTKKSPAKKSDKGFAKV